MACQFVANDRTHTHTHTHTPPHNNYEQQRQPERMEKGKTKNKKNWENKRIARSHLSYSSYVITSLSILAVDWNVNRHCLRNALTKRASLFVQWLIRSTELWTDIAIDITHANNRNICFEHAPLGAASFNTQWMIDREPEHVEWFVGSDRRIFAAETTFWSSLSEIERRSTNRETLPRMISPFSMELSSNNYL